MSLRVLQVAYPFAPVAADAVGGAEVVLAQLDAGLHARGVESLVVACEGSAVRGRLHAVAACAGPIDDAARREASARHRRAIEALVDGGGVDVVHLHGVDFWTYLPARDVPCVVTVHLPAERYPAEVLRAPRPGLRYVCVSEAARRRAAGLLDAAAVVENGVPIPRGDPAPREDFVLCLGRICAEKGFHLALAAAHAAELPLVLAGRVFPYPEHERYFAEEIGPLLDARRRFVGPVFGERKRALLARAACVAIPSCVDETSSLVAMEALAAGTPVVARRVGALGDLIEPGVTGLFADDVAALARALREAPHLDGARCRAEARRRFDVERMIGGYVEVYEGALRA